MTLEEAKKRNDYHFECSEVRIYLEEIRSNKFSSHDERNGEHIWGVAMLELGNVDIELNLLSGGTGKDGKEINEVYPCYFICLKGLISPTDANWVSAGYIDNRYPVTVDFTKNNWEEALEKDMFEKMECIVEEHNFSYDEMNFTPETERQVLEML